MTENKPRQTLIKSGRSRAGCWNCRRKKKKCDEQRPICSICTRSGEKCERGLKLVFRPEHAEVISGDHPSMRWTTSLPRPKEFDIVDVTLEVIRDYWNEALDTQSSSLLANSPQQEDGHSNHSWTLSPAESYAFNGPSRREAQVEADCETSFIFQNRTSVICSPPMQQHLDELGSVTSPGSFETLQSVAAGLLNLGRGIPTSTTEGAYASHSDMKSPLLVSPHRRNSSIASATSEGPPPDGLFVPGSAYFEFHSALRDHTLHAARTGIFTRSGSSRGESARTNQNDCKRPPLSGTRTSFQGGMARLAIPAAPVNDLMPREEYKLWKNWIDEIAPWLDKFDNSRHFGHALPTLAHAHPHLRFAMLALSARQLERKYPGRSLKSLELYQEAIHHLVPQLQTRATLVVTSCVVLCVLEMMSCSPDMWRQHLDGCASLIQSLGINGLAGGAEQALFWCFARMDLCGAFISSERTIIPIKSWFPEVGVNISAAFFSANLGFDMYANYAVYLCAKAMDLFFNRHIDARYTYHWEELVDEINKWYTLRPPEMLPIIDSTPSEADYHRPFPMLLFSNASAISGNQLYHTASLLLLQKRPPGAKVMAGSRSMLWHARRICAISISNSHHGCWTNCIQPLWIAGQVMSHPSEHRAIIETYERIEKETGWGTKWRADDLKAFWGDLSGD